MSAFELFAKHAAPAVPASQSPFRDEFLREQARDGRVLLDSRGHLIAPVAKEV